MTEKIGKLIDVAELGRAIKRKRTENGLSLIDAVTNRKRVWPSGCRQHRGAYPLAGHACRQSGQSDEKRGRQSAGGLLRERAYAGDSCGPPQGRSQSRPRYGSGPLRAVPSGLQPNEYPGKEGRIGPGRGHRIVKNRLNRIGAVVKSE